MYKQCLKGSFLTMILLLALPLSIHGALIHQWTFNDGTANDSVGTAHGALVDGASIANGSLALDGVNDVMITAASSHTITTRTLMAWVSLDNTSQRSGGLLTIEDPGGGNRFDSIVYAERTAFQWMAGSNNFHRTNIANNGGASETVASPGEVHMAITYASDNSISIYRNGVLYAAYTPSGTADPTLQTYQAGIGRFLLGKRHIARTDPNPSATGNDLFFAGTVNEARIYNTALSASEVSNIFAQGAVAVPEPSSVLLLLIAFTIAMNKHKK